MHELLVPLLAMPVGLVLALLLAAVVLRAAAPAGQHQKPRRAPHAMPGEVRHHATATGTRRGAISRRSAQYNATGAAVVRDEHPTPHAVDSDAALVRAYVLVAAPTLAGAVAG